MMRFLPRPLSLAPLLFVGALLGASEPAASRTAGTEKTGGPAEPGSATPAATTIAATAAPPTPAPAPAPAYNWVLPLFADKDGHRTMTLRGTEVRPAGKDIAVTNLSITVFTGDAKAQVDSILLSPLAVFQTKEQRARGDRSVRFIQDDIEVTGQRWTYDHAARKVSLQENVRVTFRAKLNDILK
jgi:hypothetical protein